MTLKLTSGEGSRGKNAHKRFIAPTRTEEGREAEDFTLEGGERYLRKFSGVFITCEGTTVACSFNHQNKRMEKFTEEDYTQKEAAQQR